MITELEGTYCTRRLPWLSSGAPQTTEKLLIKIGCLVSMTVFGEPFETTEGQTISVSKGDRCENQPTIAESFVLITCIITPSKKLSASTETEDNRIKYCYLIKISRRLTCHRLYS